MKGFHDKKKGIAITYDDIYLINGARTPFGKLCGTLGVNFFLLLSIFY